MPGKALKSAANASENPKFLYIYIYISAGIPQRPLPAQVTGGAASKKPKKSCKTTVFSQ
jgi:hypothetical protein